MALKTGVLYSMQTNPWLNLAVEEYLLDTVLPDEMLLYLWQNLNTVVIGRNQNPWRECATHLLEDEGGVLARRLSGGGAVFHDLGNLNFTFVAGKNTYEEEKQYRVLLDSVRSMGIPAVMSGRNDLTVDGRKFSGNAFCRRKESSYHHGTLLVNADLDKLTRYLRVSSEKMQAKGVQSVRSRVMNLSESKPGLTVKDMSDSLVTSFMRYFGHPERMVEGFDGLPEARIAHLYEKYASWDWRYGQAPSFDLEIGDRFDWGEIQLMFRLDNGIIRTCRVFSDAMDEQFILALPDCFEGRRLDKSVLGSDLWQCFKDTPGRNRMADIIRLLENSDL